MGSNCRRYIQPRTEKIRRPEIRNVPGEGLWALVFCVAWLYHKKKMVTRYTHPGKLSAPKSFCFVLSRNFVSKRNYPGEFRTENPFFPNQCLSVPSKTWDSQKIFEFEKIYGKCWKVLLNDNNAI